MTSDSKEHGGLPDQEKTGTPHHDNSAAHPASVPEPDISDSTRPRRRFKWRLVLSPAGLVLPLVLMAVLIYLVAPEVLPRQGQTRGQDLAPPAVAHLAEVDGQGTPAVKDGLTENADLFDIEVLLAEALDSVRGGRFNEALALYETLAEQHPKEPRIESAWARALLLQGEADKALAHARRAVELEPMDAEAVTVLARAYLAVGDIGRGLGMGEAAVALDEGGAASHATLAEVYLADGQLEKAADQAVQALRMDPDLAAGHWVRGWLYFSLDNDAQRALEELRLAVELQPQRRRNQLDLGRLLLQTADYEEAIPVLEQALALRQDPEVFLLLAEAYLQVGQREKAATYRDQAREAGAEETDLLALTAAIYARESRCSEASSFYEQALAQDPSSPLALEARLICQEATAQSVETKPTNSMTIASSANAPLQGRIAYPSWNPGTQQYDIYISSVDGTTRGLLLTGARQPAFSPDGLWLAVNGERHLQENLLVLRSDGSEVREITEHAEDGLPAWLPDGTSLAFSSTQHGDRQPRIYVIDAVQLDGHKEAGRALRAGSYDIHGIYPAWTMDRQVVYDGCDYAASPAVCGLLKVSTDSGPDSPTALTENPADTAPATFQGKVAFMSNREGNWDIYVVDVDGSGLMPLTQGAANEGLPAWAPDGQSLAYVSDEGGRWAVWAMDPDGSDQRKLFEIEGGGLAGDWPQERISWAP